MSKIPRDLVDDYTPRMARARQDHVFDKTGVPLEHISRFSAWPGVFRGNVEHFTGVAQVPLGFAGPLCVDGVDARGDFYVPLATTEGTLVASYNRGMRLTREAGGIRTTVIDDAMQRAPLFVFRDARAALEFGRWVEENFATIKAVAEETTSIGKLRNIEQYAIGKMRWLRFNFTTGDAAGQNMVNKATRHACMWIKQQEPKDLEHFALVGGFCTDKKHSAVNNLHTRGKRVVAEITLPSAIIEQVMHTTGAAIHRHRTMTTVASLVAGSINNGSHSANAIAAMFIACGQDVANVAESSAAFIYGDLRENGDYYFSITIPSLIVATCGGGTGLPTQRECLETLGCYGPGRVNKLAEIVAATALCGELSLTAAIVSDQWVSSHDKLGRNRPNKPAAYATEPEPEFYGRPLSEIDYIAY